MEPTSAIISAGAVDEIFNNESDIFDDVDINLDNVGDDDVELISTPPLALAQAMTGTKRKRHATDHTSLQKTRFTRLLLEV